ncbi:MAG: peptidylprolyl isomerase [Candidatus Thiodiazotropha sp. (ex Ustalcina ferruginea)]|nr:peptidylprolyl isomerase [Candidatus Thiodiazotropha sp. (ex Ustalcina ferruginea)]
MISNNLYWPINLVIVTLLILLVFTVFNSAYAGYVNESDQSSPPAFASVNGEIILLSTYQTTLHLGARRRFYHGQPPEAELIAYRQEIGDILVGELLMHQEALRQGIEPDARMVQVEFEKNLQHYVKSSGWEDANNHILSVLHEGLERRDRIRQLEEKVRDAVKAPTDSELLNYYQNNSETFTSPPQTRVSMILLKVPPWDNGTDWENKKQILQGLRSDISAGLAFSDAAKRYSDDSSSAIGGDLGYLHQGMLGIQAEAVISQLEIGEVSGPTTLLEGMALFLLHERIESQVNPLEKVRKRAQELWLRQQRELAVQTAKDRLHDEADIRYTDPDYFNTRPVATGPGNHSES